MSEIGDNPWESSHSPREVPPSRSLAFWAGVVCLVAAVLELMFAALSCIGFGMGVGMVSGVIETREEPFIDWLILIFYGLALFASTIGGAAHLSAGISLLRGRASRFWLIVACAASLLPLITVYCAPFSIAAGVMLLVVLLTPPPQAEPG